MVLIPRVLLYPSGGSVRSFDGSVKSWKLGRERGREGGREGRREGGRDGGREGGRDGWMDGWMDGWRVVIWDMQRGRNQLVFRAKQLASGE